ncbi:DUF4250 domain-containing protein [Psychromonas sp. B3M02]|uniref:DUF4250 domain-containing protein n=1 Tax=unclassified Psychromonas TaxID=2614957 RepID=UPI000DEB56B0|nr:DUF4250 domain-containing protein [Psychromonas sp. B3M02]RBW43996.1 DUF4250 domain-containing protein [Psychromonas sp. B3M02]
MLESYKTMDVNMLLSIVNMKLRNEQKTLDDLCATYEMDKSLLKERLAGAGFIYDLSNHQFKQSTY